MLYASNPDETRWKRAGQGVMVQLDFLTCLICFFIKVKVILILLAYKMVMKTRQLVGLIFWAALKTTILSHSINAKRELSLSFIRIKWGGFKNICSFQSALFSVAKRAINVQQE